MKLSSLTDMSKEDILSALGLQSKQTATSWAMGTLGLFGMGMLVGAGIALILAPKPGVELRREIGDRIKQVREKTNAQSLESAL
jgi:hypothetical protein